MGEDKNVDFAESADARPPPSKKQRIGQFASRTTKKRHADSNSPVNPVSLTRRLVTEYIGFASELSTSGRDGIGDQFWEKVRLNK